MVDSSSVPPLTPTMIEATLTRPSRAPCEHVTQCTTFHTLEVLPFLHASINDAPRSRFADQAIQGTLHACNTTDDVTRTKQMSDRDKATQAGALSLHSVDRILLH